MSKIWIISDLHNDHSKFIVPKDIGTFDAIVLAGDISKGMSRSLEWITDNLLSFEKPIIYVPGNHDFYGDDLSVMDRPIQHREHIYILSSGQTLVVNDVRFVGATLWTDFNLLGEVYKAEAAAARYLPDYRQIRFSGRGIWPKDLRSLHEQHLRGLSKSLKSEFNGKTVVITHHAPHPHSLHRKVAREPLDASYASDLSELMLQHKPQMWIHGHCHNSSDYIIHETRVLSNPRGYTSRDQKGKIRNENKEFNDKMIVDI